MSEAVECLLKKGFTPNEFVEFCSDSSDFKPSAIKKRLLQFAIEEVFDTASRFANRDGDGFTAMPVKKHHLEAAVKEIIG